MLNKPMLSLAAVAAVSPPAVVLALHVTELVPPRTALGNRNLPFLLMISVFMLWVPWLLETEQFSVYLRICSLFSRAFHRLTILQRRGLVRKHRLKSVPPEVKSLRA
jgi:hypothetical protein